MNKNTGYLFRKLKRLLRKTAKTGQNRLKIARELRYVERSCLITNTLAHNTTLAFGRTVRIIRKYRKQLPGQFLKEFQDIGATFQEHLDAAKEHGARIKRD